MSTMFCLWDRDTGELLLAAQHNLFELSVRVAADLRFTMADYEVMVGLADDIEAPDDWAYRVTQHTVTPDGAA